MSIASSNQFQKEVMQDSALQEQFKTAAAPENLSELALKIVASLNQFQKEVMQDSALQEQFKTAAAISPENLK